MGLIKKLTSTDSSFKEVDLCCHYLEVQSNCGGKAVRKFPTLSFRPYLFAQIHCYRDIPSREWGLVVRNVNQNSRKKTRFLTTGLAENGLGRAGP